MKNKVLKFFVLIMAVVMALSVGVMFAACGENSPYDLKIAVVHNKIPFFHTQYMALVDQETSVAAEKTIACNLLFQGIHAARRLDNPFSCMDKCSMSSNLYVQDIP